MQKYSPLASKSACRVNHLPMTRFWWAHDKAYNLYLIHLEAVVSATHFRKLWWDADGVRNARFFLFVCLLSSQQRALSLHLWARQKKKAYGWLSNWINSKAHTSPKPLLSAPGQSSGAPHPSAEDHSLYLFVFVLLPRVQLWERGGTAASCFRPFVGWRQQPSHPCNLFGSSRDEPPV